MSVESGTGGDWGNACLCKRVSLAAISSAFALGLLLCGCASSKDTRKEAPKIAGIAEELPDEKKEEYEWKSIEPATLIKPEHLSTRIPVSCPREGTKSVKIGVECDRAQFDGALVRYLEPLLEPNISVIDSGAGELNVYRLLSPEKLGVTSIRIEQAQKGATLIMKTTSKLLRGDVVNENAGFVLETRVLSVPQWEELERKVGEAGLSRSIDNGSVLENKMGPIIMEIKEHKHYLMAELEFLKPGPKYFLVNYIKELADVQN